MTYTQVTQVQTLAFYDSQDLPGVIKFRVRNKPGVIKVPKYKIKRKRVILLSKNN